MISTNVSEAEKRKSLYRECNSIDGKSLEMMCGEIYVKLVKKTLIMLILVFQHMRKHNFLIVRMRGVTSKLGWEWEEKQVN